MTGAGILSAPRVIRCARAGDWTYLLRQAPEGHWIVEKENGSAIAAYPRMTVDEAIQRASDDGFAFGDRL